MAGEILVLVTCPPAESEKLACALVQERLAACVNIIDGVRSIYLWQDKLCNEKEDLLVIKSNNTVWEALRNRVKALHSYDVPEIISMPVQDGHKPYMDWVNQAISARQ